MVSKLDSRLNDCEFESRLIQYNVNGVEVLPESTPVPMLESKYMTDSARFAIKRSNQHLGENSNSPGSSQVKFLLLLYSPMIRRKRDLVRNDSTLANFCLKRPEKY